MRWSCRSREGARKETSWSRKGGRLLQRQRGWRSVTRARESSVQRVMRRERRAQGPER